MRDMPSRMFNAYLRGLAVDLREYQTRFRRIFSRRLTRSRDCHDYFFRVLFSASKVYMDYLTLKTLAMRVPPAREHSTDESRVEPMSGRGVPLEIEVRARFQSRIESLLCWAQFQPNNPFVEETQLRTLNDYTRNVVWHLPEIYGECVETAGYVRRILQKKDRSHITSQIAELSVRLGHIARHASHCHYSLEILADEMNWE